MINGHFYVLGFPFPDTQRGNLLKIKQGFVNKPDNNVAVNFVLVQAADRSFTEPEGIFGRCG